MGQGGSKFERVDIIDNYDPRVTGRAATKGTMFRYIPAAIGADPIILLKQDEGFTTNWICICGPDAEVCTPVVAASTPECPPPELAPDLGEAESFVALGGSAISNTGLSVLDGDLGLDPGSSVTGFPPGVVTGTQHVNDAIAIAAKAAALAAWTDLQGRAPGTLITAGGSGLDALVLLPGTYTSATTMGLSVGATLTLDAAGDPNAVWIFQVGSALTLGGGSTILVINGGSAANVFWQMGTSATIGVGATAVGTFIADASITLATGASLSGRAWALNAALTMDTNAMTVPVNEGCGNVDVSSAPATLDGVVLAPGDLILLKDQDDPAENGVYTFNGAGLPLTRAPGWDEAEEFTVGRNVCVTGGDVNDDTIWENTSVVVTLGTDPIIFMQVFTGDFMLRDYSNATPPTRIAVNPDTLVVGTDRTLYVATNIGAIPFVVNMPAGVPGQEFWVKDMGSNAAANNITFVPNGVDTMEAGSDITSDDGARHFQFFSGVWRIISAY